MFGAVEQVRVDAERDVGGGVAELPRDEDDVRALRDEERGERVSEVVEAEARDVGAFERLL